MAKVAQKLEAKRHLIGWACTVGLTLAGCEEAKPSSAASADTANDIQLDASSGDAAGSDAAVTDSSTADTLKPDAAGTDASGTDAVASDGGGIDADTTPDSAPDGQDAQETSTPDAADTVGTDAVGPDSQQPDVAQDTQPGSKEAACVASGGTVQTSLCCGASADFPNLCSIGACGCAPQYSKDTKVCACPSGMCFDGAACVYMAD